jgi:hypothetical protein
MSEIAWFRQLSPERDSLPSCVGRWFPEGSEGGKEQSNNGCPTPSHLVVPKKPNIDVICSEIQWHTQCEQKHEAIHPFVRYDWRYFAKDEGTSQQNCDPSDNSKDG